MYPICCSFSKIDPIWKFRLVLYLFILIDVDCCGVFLTMYCKPINRSAGISIVSTKEIFDTLSVHMGAHYLYSVLPKHGLQLYMLLT